MTSARCACTTLFAGLVFVCAGCERPPVPDSAQPLGPPTAVIVDPKSEEGKQLLAERNKFHDTHVHVKSEPPPAKADKPAAAAPDMQPKLPQPAPQAPVEPTAGTQQSVTPAPAPQPPSPTPAVAGTSPPPAANAGPAGKGQQISAEDAARRKGKELGTGPIATPIGAYFSAKERIKLIQFEKELSAWVTTHNRKPRDFNELNEHVLQPAGMVLPQLRPGEKYVFDPKQGQYGTLLVEQPPPQPK